MLVACCLHFLRASNDFYTFCKTAEQEQQLALFSLQVAFQLLMFVSIVHMALCAVQKEIFFNSMEQRWFKLRVLDVL